MIGILAILSIGSTAATNPPRLCDRGTCEIAGIKLGISTDRDVERIFGRSPAANTPDHEGDRRCYVGADPNQTAIEFESWFGTIIRFRILKNRKLILSSCAKSALMANHIATNSGLKLGLEKEEVLAILGAPTKVEGSRLFYERSFERSLTSEERKRMDEVGGPPWKVKSINVIEHIKIFFVDTHVDSIDVTYNETD